MQQQKGLLTLFSLRQHYLHQVHRSERNFVPSQPNIISSLFAVFSIAHYPRFVNSFFAPDRIFPARYAATAEIVPDTAGNTNICRLTKPL